MRYWISIKVFGTNDTDDWYWHRLCACDWIRDVDVVLRALKANGHEAEARDMRSEGHPVVSPVAGK